MPHAAATDDDRRVSACFAGRARATCGPGPQAQSGRVWPVLLVLVAAAAAYAWWYLAPDTLPAWTRPYLPQSARANPVLYRWKDAKGRVQVTGTPPADRPYETLHYDPRTNVVPSVVPPPPQGTSH